MGGRGKSSGVARPAAPPLNFGGRGATPLEQLEVAGRRLSTASTAEIAKGVESAVRDLLSAPTADYARRQEEVTRVIAQSASEMKRRPLEAREAFSTRLAPLFEQLREQAGETSG